MNDVLVAIEGNTGNLEIRQRLGKRTHTACNYRRGAPMLGFSLVPVIGMVEAFFALANAGSSANISVCLQGGIYEALVTTVAGLAVGIVALFAYNALVARINGVMKPSKVRPWSLWTSSTSPPNKAFIRFFFV